MTAYSRARPSGHWIDYPDTTYGLVGSTEFEKWDQAIYDVKTLLGASNALTSPTYGPAISFGNTPTSFGFGGNGSPPEFFAPFIVYQRYGDYTGGTGAPVLKTTQAGALYANYFGPPTEDSAEAWSTYVALKDLTPLGGSAYTSTKSVTSYEAIASVEGGNSVTNTTIAIGSHVWNGTGTLATAANFYIGSQLNSGTISNWYGFYQSASPSGTVTNKWGAYFIDRVQTETGIHVAKTGDSMNFMANIAGSGGGSPAFVYVQNPDSTNMRTMRLQSIAGQTAPILSCWTSGGDESFFVSSAGVGFSHSGFVVQSSGGTNLSGANTAGLWVQTHAAPSDGTVATGQCYLWFDQTAGAAKLMFKAKDAGGTVRTGSVALA